MFDVLPTVVVVVLVLVTLPFDTVVEFDTEVVVFEALAFEVLIVFEVLPIVVFDVLVTTAVFEVLVLTLLALAFEVSLPPQAAPRAPSARTVESARTFFMFKISPSLLQRIFFRISVRTRPCPRNLFLISGAKTK